MASRAGWDVPAPPGPGLSEGRGERPGGGQGLCPGLPLWAESVVGVLQARLALEGQGAAEGEGRRGVSRGSAPLRRSQPASPARGLAVSCGTHTERQTRGKGSPPLAQSQGGVRSCGMGSERLPGTCPAAP